MPDTAFLDIPEEEQAQMLAALRRARYGYLLALHVLLLCAAGRNPTDIAAFLFCSRSSVYRIVRLYRARKLGFTVDAEGQLMAPVRTTILMPWMKRSLGALLKAPPRAYGWSRIRWHTEQLQAHEVMVFADELDIHLLPKVGAAWMPKGSQEEVMTPGQNEKHYLAGALNLATGKILHCLGPRKNNA